MRPYPYSFLILTGLGIASAIPGLLSLAGFGTLIHPVLADTGAGIALMVTAIALVGSGLFPLVISRLISADPSKPPPPG